jgi:V/A-type H+-transporting ATPase subunit I
MVQLVWARGKNIRKLLPSLSALAQAGWLVVVAGIYFLVLFMLLKVELPSFVPWLISGGTVCVLIFSEQRSPVGDAANFLKNIGRSFSNIISILLKAIGSFADIISYIRLFAVGTAGIMIIKTINSMAIPSEGFGNFGPAFLLRLAATVLVLVIGHTLHLLMGILSMIVHGLRLNLLEYAGNHLGMEWSGYVYKPFSFRQKKL